MIISPFSRLVLALSVLALVFLFIAQSESFTPRDALERAGLYEIPNLDIQVYNLQSTTREELVTEINSRGPRDPTGRQRWARVNWTITWNWPKDSSGKADFKRTRGNYKIRLQFPQWTPQESTSPELQRVVRKMLYTMALHEKEHILNVLNNYKLPAQRIIAEVERNPSLNEAQANKIANDALEEIRKFDRKYDSATEYGKLQGITL